MRILKCVAWLVLLISASAVSAEEFDRSAEVDEYVGIMTNGTRAAATNAARQISSSGISDARLAAAVNERLQRDYADLVPLNIPGILGPAAIAVRASNNTVDEDYGIRLVRALASFGIADYEQTLQKIAMPPKSGGPKVKKMRKAAQQEFARMDWYQTRNKIMASKDNYQPGDDPRDAMLVNLLLSDDLKCRDYALDTVSSEKRFDPKILHVLENQVRQYASESKGIKNRPIDNLIAANIKLLGLSGDAQYRGVINEVLASNAVEGVKKHATVALRRLQ